MLTDPYVRLQQLHMIWFRTFFCLSIIVSLAACGLSSCAVSRQPRKDQLPEALQDSLFQHAHVGFALYDPVAGKMLEQYQANKYFVPASNVKIFTCFAGIQHLGERLPGIEWVDLDTAILLLSTGDPTLLHPDFAAHSVAAFLRAARKPVYITDLGWRAQPLGSGWSWDDYSAYYMVERSPLPVYGNVIRWYQLSGRKETPSYPGDTVDVFVYSEPEVDWPVDFAPSNAARVFEVDRDRDRNRFIIRQGREASAMQEVPFVTNGLHSAIELLQDSLHVALQLLDSTTAKTLLAGRRREMLWSQPVDSLLRLMMHRSDNFYAEQTLLMAGGQRYGVMDEHVEISGLLASELAGIPQVPRWADGSGLSRYNLFTPESFVWVMDNMQRSAGMERLKKIFPSSGDGTLSGFMAEYPGRVYAKTGTLSGVIALSGYVQADSGRWLIFSLLVNNHRQSARLIRKQMEVLLTGIIKRY